jgi:hypothetical protein
VERLLDLGTNLAAVNAYGMTPWAIQVQAVLWEIQRGFTTDKVVQIQPTRQSCKNVWAWLPDAEDIGEAAKDNGWQDEEFLSLLLRGVKADSTEVRDAFNLDDRMIYRVQMLMEGI